MQATTTMTKSTTGSRLGITDFKKSSRSFDWIRRRRESYISPVNVTARRRTDSWNPTGTSLLLLLLLVPTGRKERYTKKKIIDGFVVSSRSFYLSHSSVSDGRSAAGQDWLMADQSKSWFRGWAGSITKMTNAVDPSLFLNQQTSNILIMSLNSDSCLCICFYFV